MGCAVRGSDGDLTRIDLNRLDPLTNALYVRLRTCGEEARLIRFVLDIYSSVALR